MAWIIVILLALILVAVSPIAAEVLGKLFSSVFAIVAFFAILLILDAIFTVKY